jgi:hypothetical protein
MPQVYSTVGMNGVLVFFAAFCALGLVFVRHLPDSGDHIETTGEPAHISPALKGISFAAILSYNITIGIVWAYLFLAGLQAGMGEQGVANALTLSQFLGIAGAFLAVLFEVRLGRLLPLAIGVLGGAASVYYLVGDIGGFRSSRAHRDPWRLHAVSGTMSSTRWRSFCFWPPHCCCFPE